MTRGQAGSIAGDIAAEFKDKGARCKFGRILDDIEPDDRAAVDKVLAAVVAHRQVHGHRSTNGPSVPKLVDLLARHGHKTSRLAVNEHLAGRCVCRDPEEATDGNT